MPSNAEWAVIRKQRHADVLRLRGDGKTLRQIGALMGLSVERIRQLETQAKRMREEENAPRER